mmetsp:Transcript_9337/g.25370  ORF Transcript_9337/g.25370 Transcript_9337/m.25370 type:complete len:230 (-) Transcript_9337:1154-1843(-)
MLALAKLLSEDLKKTVNLLKPLFVGLLVYSCGLWATLWGTVHCVMYTVFIKQFVLFAQVTACACVHYSSLRSRATLRRVLSASASNNAWYNPLSVVWSSSYSPLDHPSQNTGFPVRSTLSKNEPFDAITTAAAVPIGTSGALVAAHMSCRKLAWVPRLLPDKFNLISPPACPTPSARASMPSSSISFSDKSKYSRCPLVRRPGASAAAPPLRSSHERRYSRFRVGELDK